MKMGHCSARIQLITIISQDSELKLLEEYKISKIKKILKKTLEFPLQVGSDKQPSPRGHVVPYPAHEGGFDRHQI